MTYICSKCESINWVLNGSVVECLDCGSITTLESMKKVKPRQVHNLNEIIPKENTQDLGKFKINE